MLSGKADQNTALSPDISSLREKISGAGFDAQ